MIISFQNINSPIPWKETNKQTDGKQTKKQTNKFTFVGIDIQKF